MSTITVCNIAPRCRTIAVSDGSGKAPMLQDWGDNTPHYVSRRTISNGSRQNCRSVMLHTLRPVGQNPASSWCRKVNATGHHLDRLAGGGSKIENVRSVLTPAFLPGSGGARRPGPFFVLPCPISYSLAQTPPYNTNQQQAVAAFPRSFEAARSASSSHRRTPL